MGKSMKLRSKSFQGVKLCHVKEKIDPSFWLKDAHSHSECEIFFNVKGKLDIFVEHNHYIVTDKTIRLYGSEELHFGKSDDLQNMEWYSITLYKPFLKKEKYAPLLKVFHDRKFGTGNLFYSSKFDEIISLFHEVFTKYENQNPLWENYMQSAVIKALCCINESENNILLSKTGSQLANITNLIAENFKSLSTLSDLCKLTNYSPSYINKLFKEGLGITPYKYIQTTRLNNAKVLLQKGMSLTKTCIECGYTDYNNFITLFKKTFGQTPYRWIKENN